jgi:energy-coupling factor transporter ATP-binding protein EcfA2
MKKADTGKKISSPISTGNVGSDFESFVGAYYLAMVLLQSTPRGQDAGTAKEVRFQRLYEGEPLDDLIIVSELPIGEAKLAIQAKRDFAFGENDETFDEIMRASWETFKSPKFIRGKDRVGFAIGLPPKVVSEHYQNVLTRARNSAGAEDFIKGFSIPGLFSKQQGSFVKLIREKLSIYEEKDIMDNDLWNFLRSMVILDFDFHRTGSRDQSYIIEILSHLIPPEKHIRSIDLFSQLYRYAASEAKGVAGSLNLDILREKLISSGFPLLSPPDCRGDIKRLQEHGDLILKDIISDIEGLILNREDIIYEAGEKIKGNSLLELIGSPGAGKSAILKSLVGLQRAEGPVLVLAWDRIDVIGWNGFSNYLRLERSLQEILIAISSNSNPCIFIDGIDRILGSGPRKVINDLFRNLKETPLSHDDSKHWTVVITAREDNLQEVHSWIDWSSIGKIEQLKINDFEDREVNVVFESNPRLKPLIALPQLKPIIKNPFMLRLIVDQRMIPEPHERPNIASEIEVSKTWWKNIVGKDVETGRERQRALIQLGKEDILSPGRWLSGDGISSTILRSLELDHILLRDEDRDMYRFSHDLLEDWVLYRVLDKERDNLAGYLKEINQPFGLVRPTQLLGQSLLESCGTEYIWATLLRQLGEDNDIAFRWRQALLTAPILSTQVQVLLDRVRSFLKDDNAKCLIDLLIALRTTQMDLDRSFPIIAKKMGYKVDEINLLQNQYLLPRWHIWIPFIGWLLKNLDDFTEDIRPEVTRIMEIWQLKTPYGAIYRKDIANIAFRWLSQIQR